MPFRKAGALLFFSLVALASCVPPTPEERLPEMETETPEPGKTAVSLVWMPAAGRRPAEITDILHGLLRGEDSHLTVGLPAEKLPEWPEEEKARLIKWRDNGSLDIALIPSGGLPIPLLTGFSWHLQNSFGVERRVLREAPVSILKPYEASWLFVHSAELWQIHFPSQTAPGFALPLGLTDENTCQGAAGGGAPWIIASATGSARHFLSASGIPVFAAQGLNPPLTDEESETMQGRMEKGGIYAIQESYGLSPEQSENMLKNFMRWEKNGKFSTVPLQYWRNAAPENTDAAAAPAFFPRWGSSNALKFLWGSPAQTAYWKLAARIREDIAAYQNSGKAKIEILDSLWQQYYAILAYSYSSAFQEMNRDNAEGALAEDALRAAAGAIYSRLSKAAKTSLSHGLPDSLWGAGEQPPSGHAASEGLGWAITDDYDPPNPSLDLFPDIREAAVSWDNREIHFEINVSSPMPEKLEAEIYLDLNQRPYTGQERSWNGLLRAAPADFWEYLIRVSGEGDVLVYRYQSGSDSRLIKRMETAGKFQENTVSFSVPRNLISGRDPNRWGWATCVLSDSKGDCLQAFSSDSGVLPFIRPQAE